MVIHRDLVIYVLSSILLNIPCFIYPFHEWFEFLYTFMYVLYMLFCLHYALFKKYFTMKIALHHWQFLKTLVLNVEYHSI